MVVNRRKLSINHQVLIHVMPVLSIDTKSNIELGNFYLFTNELGGSGLKFFLK